MYLRNRTIRDKSTKYWEIQDNFLIFPKYRKYRTSESPALSCTKQKGVTALRNDRQNHVQYDENMSKTKKFKMCIILLPSRKSIISC